MSERDLSERLPTPDEADRARNATTVLARMTDEEGALFLHLKDGHTGQTDLVLPPAVSALMLELLMLIAKGEAVTLVPYGAELSTQEASDLLNVSRPFLIKLIDQGEIPHFMVGTHRRLKAEDVLSYKQRRDANRQKSLAKLARLGQDIEEG